MYKLINVFDRNRKNGQFLAIFAMKNAIFSPTCEKLYKN